MIKIKWTLDYSGHYYSQAKEAMAQDEEFIRAYAAVEDRSESKGGVVTIIATYEDSDGWDARGQVEETETQIGSHANYSRVVD